MAKNNLPTTSLTDKWGGAFCPNCSSHFAAFPDDQPANAVIRVGTLDKECIARLGKPRLEIFVTRRIDWCSPIEGARQCDEFPQN